MAGEAIKLKLNNSVLNNFLNARTGPVGRHLEKIGNEIIVMGRPLAGRETGRLQGSFRLTHNRTTVGPQIIVGAYTDYAYDVHEGTPPHIIVPNKGRVIQFRTGGKTVFAQVVRHPGTRAKKYLTIPMEAVVRRS